MTALTYPRAVPDYYLVKRLRGPDWDASRGIRDQSGWPEHAAFMDALAEEGVVVLGGPVGDGDGSVLLVVNVGSEAQIRDRLAEDPWADALLTIESVNPWSVWLRAG